MSFTGYDIIGDVHGCAGKLEDLLAGIGYALVDGAYTHPARQAVFVGDFIDRGDEQLRSVAIPKAMVDAGTALAVIGNHEFNAVSMATKDAAGEWNMEHKAGKLEATAIFRASTGFDPVPEDGHVPPEHQEVMDWFMTLPLWLDLGGVRVVHACWHEPSMRVLEPLLSPVGGLTPELLEQANIKNTPAYNAIEIVLKGPETELDGYYYTDSDNHLRREGRIDWWKPGASTVAEAVRLADKWQLYDAHGVEADDLPNTPLPDSLRGIEAGPDRSPLVFGHYWFEAGDSNETLKVIGDKAACVDFSAVNGGPLVAYRWSGESALDSANLVTAAMLQDNAPH